MYFSNFKEEEDDYEDESGSNSECESDTSSGIERNANKSSSSKHSTKPNNVDSSHRNSDSSGWHRTGILTFLMKGHLRLKCFSFYLMTLNRIHLTFRLNKFNIGVILMKRGIKSLRNL